MALVLFASIFSMLFLTRHLACRADESGEISSEEELQGLVTNLCVKLKCRVNPGKIKAACEGLSPSSQPIQFDPFVEWFAEAFL